MTRFIAVLAAATLLAAPALAEARSVTVRYADLDLKSEAGRTRLDRRIAAATEQVCGSYANASAEEGVQIDRCRRDVQRNLAGQFAARALALKVARR